VINLDYWTKRLLGKQPCRLSGKVRLSSKARILNAQNAADAIAIGANSFIGGELFVFAHGGDIAIGEWCFIGEGSRIWSAKRISIGDRVLISHNVNVFDSLTHPLLPEERHKQFRSIMENGHPRHIDLGERQVIIEEDVWVGANASILRGVTLGRGSVVGVGAVVTRDVAPFSVVVGNPARVVRSLKPESEAPVGR
jgi:acetyltransferase-like isoleucine patch superfamily enzyme